MIAAAVGLLAAAAPMVSPLTAQESVLKEEVEVARVVVDLRVVDRHGQPIPGLGPDDFRVRVDGKEVRIETVEWVTGASPRVEFPSEVEGSVEEILVSPPGRLIVLFFQRHIYVTRMVGLMKALERAREFVQTLNPEDHLAILSFDTHLDLYSDFTQDRDHSLRILEESIVPYRPPPPIEAGAFPSLAKHFDAKAARRVTSAEAGLLVTAKALKHLPGSKSLIFIGYGMGTFVGGAVQMRPEYSDARRTLMDARTAVFTLDVTRADYHTLQSPLIKVARDTGGLYRKTFYSGYVAMDAVARAISGHYELVFEKPDLPPGRHWMKINLRERRADLYHRWFYDG